jgi:hypothetical protein
MLKQYQQNEAPEDVTVPDPEDLTVVRKRGFLSTGR